MKSRAEINERLLNFTSGFIAAAILEMRKAETEDDFREVLFVINAHIANMCANVMIELDQIDNADNYLDALRQHLVPAIVEMAAVLREFRTHYHKTDTETIN